MNENEGATATPNSTGQSHKIILGERNQIPKGTYYIEHPIYVTFKIRQNGPMLLEVKQWLSGGRDSFWRGHHGIPGDTEGSIS